MHPSRTLTERFCAPSPNSPDPSFQNVQRLLEKELARLKRTLDMGYGLRVEWKPGGSETLDGEVKGSTICIYSKDADEAVRALKHEFLDHAVSQVIEPYKQVTNALIALKNQESYRQKERLIDRLLSPL